MAPFYTYFVQETGINVDNALLTKMQTKNSEEIKTLDDRLLDAEQNLGETEISEALIAKAHYLAKIGEKLLLWFQNDC